MKRLVFLVMILMSVLAAGSASAFIADSVVTLVDTSVNPGIAQSIHAGGLGDVSALAGNYILQVSAPVDSPYLGTYTGFCVDPSLAPSLSGGPQTYKLLPINETSLGSAYYPTYRAAAWILDQQHNNVSGYTDDVLGQLAVWSLVWNTLGGTGTFVYKDSTYTTGQIDAIVTAAKNAASTFDPSAYLLAASPITGPFFNAQPQDYLIRAPRIPLPPTVWLFGTGLLGLAGAWRRARR